MREELLHAINDPEQLEALYRRNPEEFAAAFHALANSNVNSPLIRFWTIRLRQEPTKFPAQAAVAAPLGVPLGWWVLLLSLLAGTVAKLPDFLNLARPEVFYLRNVGLIVFPALAAYFILTRPVAQRVIAIAAGVFIIAAVYVNQLPEVEGSDTLLLVYLHLPLFLWTVTGLVFTGRWSAGAAARVGYLKFNGEHAIYSVLLMIAGQMLTMLTIGLFYAIKIEIFEWYLHWGVVYGAAAVPIVGAHLAWLRSRSAARISPVIARIFAPLVLVTLVAYLITVGVQGKSPYTDREFLISFNAMMLAVMAICTFALAERQRRPSVDLVTLGLLVTGLTVDLVGLSAILFRLGSYGFTPNRIAVLGANVLLFANAAGLLVTFLRDWRQRAELASTTRLLSGFLPAYAAWTAFIAIVFPFLYQFR